MALSAFVLAEYLLQRPPFGGWSDVRAVDLGSGTGVVGIALALAGADVVLTDLPHVTPLTQRNVDANCRQHRCRAQVVDYAWGESLAPLGPKPDLITGADVVYQQEHFEALTDTICRLSDSHTLTYLAFRKRGRREHVFEELLEQRGLAVVTIPKQYLHEEYRDGDYKLLRICKLGP
ncbi:hypothetical protein WJX72_005603 [[Myrmecia] bisecta]|uniref:Uncharacterized protein n=1 Tax=[Myrmecia] bisecta TaxID=41462 RepID=A0AAW1R773_9CHLO